MGEEAKDKVAAEAAPVGGVLVNGNQNGAAGAVDADGGGEERKPTEAEIAETVAAFDGEMDCAGIDLAEVDRGDGEDKPNPERDEKHYTERNIVMFDVPHVRVCRGEGPDVVMRTRSAEAEAEVVGVIERIGAKNQPDWFTEFWFDGFRQLVVVAVFEREDAAAEFKRAMHGAKLCRPRGGKGLRERMLAKYNHAWTKAHDANWAKMVKFVNENDEEFGHRVILVRLPYEGGEAEARAKFDELAAKVTEAFPAEGGKLKFHWSVVNDMTEKMLRIGFGGEDEDEVMALRDRIVEWFGTIVGTAHGLEIEVSTRAVDADLAVVVVIENAMLSERRKREAAARAEAIRTAKGGKPMGEPVRTGSEG